MAFQRAFCSLPKSVLTNCIHCALPRSPRRCRIRKTASGAQARPKDLAGWSPHYPPSTPSLSILRCLEVSWVLWSGSFFGSLLMLQVILQVQDEGTVQWPSGVRGLELKIETLGISLGASYLEAWTPYTNQPIHVVAVYRIPPYWPAAIDTSCSLCQAGHGINLLQSLLCPLEVRAWIQRMAVDGAWFVWICVWLIQIKSLETIRFSGRCSTQKPKKLFWPHSSENAYLHHIYIYLHHIFTYSFIVSRMSQGRVWQPKFWRPQFDCDQNAELETTALNCQCGKSQCQSLKASIHVS